VCDVFVEAIVMLLMDLRAYFLFGMLLGGKLKIMTNHAFPSCEQCKEMGKVYSSTMTTIVEVK
jgi:hypothetical protein